MRQNTFKIPDSGKMSTPFKELHFYKWLDENEKEGNHHRIKTKTKYLESLGFVKGEDKLSSDDLCLLKHTLDYHWDFNFKAEFKRQIESQITQDNTK